jgi:hemolysin activation/secretion protein
MYHIDTPSSLGLRPIQSSWWAGVAAGVFVLMPVGWVHAQTNAALALSSPNFAIRGFDITGDNPLPDAEVTRILAPFLRSDATMETLQKATVALESALKDKGFALHRVALPPQEVGRSVNLRIVKFVIGKITVEGNSRLSEAHIRARLPELTEGSAPNFNTLAVQTTIANESQGKRLQVALKESAEADKIDARIVVKEAPVWNLALGLNNAGSSSTGQDRFTVSGGHTNVWDLDHQLVAAYTTSLQKPSAVRQLGLNYRAPLARWGGVLGLSYTRSDVAGDFGAFQSTGAGRTAGVSYQHYLAPHGGYRGIVEFGLDDKQFDVTEINGIALPGQSVRRSLPLSLGFNARKETDAYTYGYNFSLAMNMSASGDDVLRAYQSEDPRISKVRWNALRGGGHYASSAWGQWIWGVRGQFQFSPDALIAGEQFGVGGMSSVRGTTERPMSGDSGAQMSLELTSPEWLPGLRMLGFVDAGWLKNSVSVPLSKPENDSVSSVGLGLRYALNRYSVNADFGHALSGSTVPAAVNSSLPHTGDQKLHVSVFAKF